MRVSEKRDRFGLDYHPTSRHLTVSGGKRFNLIRFSSAGYQWYSSVVVMNEESSDQHAVSGLIHKCPLGFKLDNSTYMVVTVVFSKEM